MGGSNLPVKVDDDDYVDLRQYKWYLHPRGYAQAYIQGKMVLMHRFIMQPGSLQIDHMDGDKTNNQRSNLRIVRHGTNIQNVPPKANNTSGFVGISKNGIYWQANIYKDGKRLFLGNFKDKLKAASAYNTAALELYGNNAYLNPTST